MLAEKRKATSEVAEKIREGEALCPKAADAITAIWGALLEDDIAKKIRKIAQDVDEKISATKVEMWKLPLQQKVIKNVEIKRLQQEMQTFCEKEKYRKAKVEEF